MTDDTLISEDWLKSVGFKFHQFERQPNKHWVLWLGRAVAYGMFSDTEDLGIEVSDMQFENRNGDRVGTEAWFCWLRSDTAGRYHRFIHLRHIKTRAELIALVEAISGQPWDPSNHRYGSVLTPEAAERDRKRDEDLDRRLMKQQPWSDIEKDDSRGRALPEHMEAYEKGRAS